MSQPCFYGFLWLVQLETLSWTKSLIDVVCLSAWNCLYFLFCHLTVMVSEVRLRFLSCVNRFYISCVSCMKLFFCCYFLSLFDSVFPCWFPVYASLLTGHTCDFSAPLSIYSAFFQFEVHKICSHVLSSTFSWFVLLRMENVVWYFCIWISRVHDDITAQLKNINNLIQHKINTLMWL